VTSPAVRTRRGPGYTRGRWLGLVVGAAVLVGAGGDTALAGDDPCRELTTAKTRHALVLFGANDRLTRRTLCRRLGRPDAFRRRGHREFWTYADQVVVVDRRSGRVMAIR
jgi:hypothetical protein